MCQSNHDSLQDGEESGGLALGGHKGENVVTQVRNGQPQHDHIKL